MESIAEDHVRGGKPEGVQGVPVLAVQVCVTEAERATNAGAEHVDLSLGLESIAEEHVRANGELLDVQGRPALAVQVRAIEAELASGAGSDEADRPSGLEPVVKHVRVDGEPFAVQGGPILAAQVCVTEV